MTGHGRPHGTCRWAQLALGLSVLLPAWTIGARAQSSDWPREMLADAELADVTFVDPLHGWAVGDRGVIWHTRDGGQHWQLQRSPVPCRLQSVFFLDADNGWAVGGFAHPYTHKSTGVVLHTHDGGQHWSRVEGLTLPALTRVKFFAAGRGWAWGNASAMYPSGVFRTNNSGRTWSSPPGGMGSGWLTGDFRNPHHGAAAGRGGNLAVLTPNGIERARAPDTGLRHFRSMRFAGPAGGWLVGDGSLAMTTTDGGISWQIPPSLSATVGGQFDFTALAVRDGHMWLAGSPGTRVFHTSDGGRTWNPYKTGQNLPIHGLTFIDASHGWAVGSLGIILATRDGGQTWHRQHSGASRAALAGFFSQGSAIPLEAFARLAGNEGYLSVVEILNRGDVVAQSPAEAPLDDRAHAALITVGASGTNTAWRFPLRQEGLKLSAGEIVQTWNRANGGHGIARLEQHVVGKIRQWRPDVIFTHPADPRGNDPLGYLINQIVLAAMEKAADAAQYPDQMSVAGLAPWNVKKLYSVLPAGQQGTVSITTAQLAPRLGDSLADRAATARGLLVGRHQTSPASLGFRLLVDRLPQAAGRRDFFSGMTLPAGGEARRLLGPPAVENLASLGRKVQRRRNVQQLLARSGKTLDGSAGWLGQIAELTRGQDESSSAQVLDLLARRYHQRGLAELAAETFQLLTQRYSKDPLCESALLYLVQYYGSSEAGWRQRKGSRFTVRQTSAWPPRDGAFPVQAAEAAVALGKRIAKTRPALFAEPSLRFPLAAAQRAAGLPRNAQSYYLGVASSRSQDAWRTCAQGELWIAHKQATPSKRLPPKKLWRCAHATSRPRLDGKLDDAVWRSAKLIQLADFPGEDNRLTTEAMLARDGQFLYLAVRCQQSPAVKYPTTDAPRPRDPDLSGRDRIELLIDLDRDYATYYRFTVDYRGWTGEACWGDMTWNPTWYVAAARGQGTWIIEAAIPLNQITAQPPAKAAVWAVGIQRIVPGVGFQSWTQPAAIKIRPEGFGFLVFE